jgi:hypothetical protein
MSVLYTVIKSQEIFMVNKPNQFVTDEYGSLVIIKKRIKK